MPFADAETARTYQREYRRLRRAGECTTPSQPLPTEFRLRKAEDVVRVLEQQMEAVRTEESAGVLERARCIGYLSAIALKAIEAGDVAARVEALETVLKRRKQDVN